MIDLSKDNRNFFSEKKPWSKVKDELLECYLNPYFQKIFQTHRPTIYVDCFAGKGKFDDGSKGSPLIALEIIDKRTNTFTNVKAYFIESNYADDLRKNLERYPCAEVLQGKYEDQIEEILSGKSNCNVFLYIDPYGIKSLNQKFLASLSNRFASIEILLNFNSWGFLRFACKVLKVMINSENEEFFTDLIERDESENIKLESTLNDIAGGDYWIDIVEKYRDGKISFYQAETVFTKEYCDHLRMVYRYVLNMPIRIEEHKPLKYRMIHATNHEDGAVIMAHNMFKRWELVKSSRPSPSLFHENANEDFISKGDLNEKIKQHMMQFREFQTINRITADFFNEFGVICSTSDIMKVGKDLEKNQKILVHRNPERTEKGKPSTFWSESKEKILKLKWND